MEEKALSGEIVDLGSEYSEILLDSFLDDSILKEVPIVGTMLRAIKIGKNIKDVLFIKKLHKFLFELKSIQQTEIDKFSQHLETDNINIGSLGSSLLLLIDKQNDFIKSEYLGKLFVAYLKGHIERGVFFKLANILDHCFIDDLDILYTKYSGKLKYKDNREDILFALGLVNLVGTDGRSFITGGNDPLPMRPDYVINEFGQVLLDIIILPNKNAR